MNELLDTLLWRQFWQITLLIPAAVLLVRYLLPKSPHLAYGILLLVLVKAIFPPVWDSPTGILWEMVPYVSRTSPTVIVQKPPLAAEQSRTFQISDAAPVQKEKDVLVSTDSKPSTFKSSESRGAIPIQSPPFPWWQVLLTVWVAGVLSLLGYILGKRAQLLRFHRDTQIPASDELLEAVEVVSAELGLLHIPKVLVTLHPTVPFASGFLHQVVVLPSHVVQQTEPAELKLILAHEMTHLRRGDTLVGLLQLVVQVVWWFHPLVYWLNREVRRIREECCDTDVVTQLKCQPANYARCLLNMLELHQQLRPSKELVGLSPLEVTTKRMQNIMRTQKHQARTRYRILSSLSWIAFAFAILPSSATSTVTPKVIVGALEPPAAKRVVSSSETKRSIKKSRPKKFSGSTQQSPSKPQLTPDSESVQTPERQSSLPVGVLNYDFVRGDQHPYHIKIEAKYPTEIRTHEGSPTFRVDAYASGIPAFFRLNKKFTNVVVPRPGVQLPTLSNEISADEDSSMFRYATPPSFDRLFSPFAEEQPAGPVSGSNGQLDPTEGQLPYLLGSLDSWVFPKLPPDVAHTWQEQSQREIRLTAPKNFSVSPFTTPHQEAMHATIQVHMAADSVSDETVTFARTWTLKTSELANDEPRRELSLNGKILFDVKLGMPVSASYSGRLVEREPNREYRIPMLIEIHRIK